MLNSMSRTNLKATLADTSAMCHCVGSNKQEANTQETGA